MKKALSRFVSFILLLAAVFFGAYFGSDLIEDYVDGILTERLKSDAMDKYGDCVGFLNAEEYDGSALYAVKTSVLENYTEEYGEYNSRILYSSLETDTEKLVYRAYEYAFDNLYNYVFFDKSVIGDDVDFEKILHFFTMDSPVAEQNIAYSVSGKPDAYIGAVYTYENEKGRKVKVKLEGYMVTVETFKGRDPEKYAEAVDKAQRIVANMPDGLTDMEKAEYLYKYMCRNTVYKEYGDFKTEQLYDALIVGETVCDGFSNALSLLYNIAGIPCFEKLYLETDEIDGEGHTWDSFLVDGVWYNADLTYNDSLEAGSALELALEGFAFSDRYQNNIPKYADEMPQCTGDTLYANREYFSGDIGAYELLGALIQSWRDGGTRVGCIFTDNMTGEEFEKLKEDMRSGDRMPEVDTYYFFRTEYTDVTALVFINSTDYR